MEAYPYYEKMEEVVLDDERGSHWRMVFEDNQVGRDYYKYLLYDNRWYVYISVIRSLIKGEYSV